MTVNQLSVFIENKSGTLLKVLEVLKEKRIQLVALTIADTAEYGICRSLCSEPSRAYQVLREAGVAVSMCEVLAVVTDDVPGGAADAVSLFAREGISIAYLYSLMMGGKAIMVFRTDNAEKAEEVIRRGGLRCIGEKELESLS